MKSEQNQTNLAHSFAAAQGAGVSSLLALHLGSYWENEED